MVAAVSSRALVIFDQFKAQTTTVVEVPANCTNRLQPLDLRINKPIKDHLKSCFHEWYAAGIRKKTLTGDNDRKVMDLRLSLLKPLGFQWLDSGCTYIQASDFVQRGFHAAGITDVLSDIM